MTSFGTATYLDERPHRGREADIARPAAKPPSPGRRGSREKGCGQSPRRRSGSAAPTRRPGLRRVWRRTPSGVRASRLRLSYTPIFHHHLPHARHWPLQPSRLFPLHAPPQPTPRARVEGVNLVNIRQAKKGTGPARRSGLLAGPLVPAASPVLTLLRQGRQGPADRRSRCCGSEAGRARGSRARAGCG